MTILLRPEFFADRGFDPLFQYKNQWGHSDGMHQCEVPPHLNSAE